MVVAGRGIDTGDNDCMRGLISRLPAPLRDLLAGDGDDARARSGALLTFAIRITSALLAFLMQVLLARWLGAFDFGVYTYVWVWVNVLGTLCTVGFSTSSVRFLAEYARPHLHAFMRGFLRMGRLLSAGMGFVMAAIGIAAIHLFPDLAESHYVLPMTIGFLSLPAFALTDFHDGTGRARHWFTLAFLPPYILRPLLILVFVGLAALFMGRTSATVAAAALTLSTWVTALVQFLLQHRRFSEELAEVPARYRTRQWIAVSLPLLLMDSFSLLMMNIDVLLLELFVTPDRIAVYFAAARTISFIAFIHFAIVAVAMPRFAAAFAERDAARAARQLKRFRMWTLWPSLAAAAFFLLTGKYILALFGEEFPAAWPVMFALVSGHLARALAGPVQALLVVSGRQNYTATVTGLTAAMNIALNLVLIPRFGLVGAGAATAIAFAFEALVLSIAARRTLEKGFGETSGTEDKA